MQREIQPNEFIIRANGDVKAHFEKGEPISIEVSNPHGDDDPHDFGALSFIKVAVKKLNNVAKTEQALKTANVQVANVQAENEKLKAALNEARKERDDALRKCMLIKKSIFDILK